MIGHAPGTILQMMYIKYRLKLVSVGNFVEIGSGNGHLSQLLLRMGWKGEGYDLNKSACQNNMELNHRFVQGKLYQIHYSDFITSPIVHKVDLVVSCMVIEHLLAEELDQLMKKCKQVLAPGGKIVFLVPSNQKYWGIEDDIAGHIKRYEKLDVAELANRHKLKLEKITGLTYPISNVLLRLSNYLVKKNESKVLSLTEKERTVYTGNRQVSLKTTFPKIFNLVLNPIVLFPFYLLQLSFGRLTNSMVIYFELRSKL